MRGDARRDTGALEATAPIDCLVVDDEPLLVQLLSHVMQDEGYRCHEAADGIEALNILERQPITLILSDMRMPRMDGVDLLKQVRDRWPDTAMIMLTAVSEVDVAVKCLATGAMDYLAKPCHLEELRARVRQALEKRRLRIENREHQQGLEARVAVQARRLEQLFLAGIQSLAEALEAKDPYTRGHSVRVSEYSTTIATAMGLEPEVVRQIQLGGHVHDIGKIGVREEVLRKPLALTEDEYRHIMTHPMVGWRILAPLFREEPIVLNVVRWHHERIDGTGLPDRLRGNQIPIEARIAAVADAFDAMTSGRPYRGTEMSLEDALRELERHSGTHFDNSVVSTAVQQARQGRFRIASSGRYEAIPVSH